ncbi:hypothetical protein Scep_018089 [Stephania cephalantha]|uniref:Uncharacterized protein n=1 Tax=Stephania cephalantha TaxID=152367 RepID=A0AAP0NXJ4_9MAGN
MPHTHPPIHPTPPLVHPTTIKQISILPLQPPDFFSSLNRLALSLAIPLAVVLSNPLDRLLRRALSLAVVRSCGRAVVLSPSPNCSSSSPCSLAVVRSRARSFEPVCLIEELAHVYLLESFGRDRCSSTSWRKSMYFYLATEVKP